MANLARQYKARYGVALNHYLEGNAEAAVDICWELRREPQVGVYRRAIMNLLLAHALSHGQLRYAQEAFDLIDILRQDSGGALNDNAKEVQSIAEDFVMIFEANYPAQASTIVQDPDTGLLTSDPVALADSSKAMEGVEDGKSSDDNGNREDEKSQLIYTYRSDPNDKGDVVPDNNNTVALEGMLRHDTYEPLVGKSKPAAALAGASTSATTYVLPHRKSKSDKQPYNHSGSSSLGQAMKH